MAKRNVTGALALACAVWLPSVVLADEVVHFTNGAEMAVRSHTVEKDMVKLDLGNNSFIAFPMTMVDKIVNSGQDVFLNPAIHPANQAVAGSSAPDTTTRGGNTAVASGVQPIQKGGAGMILGEAADVQPQLTRGNPDMAQADVNKLRRVFNPAFPQPPGSSPEVIVPPSMKQPGRMTMVTPKAAPVQPVTPPPPPEPEPTPPPE
jgi:hypothetical protein